MAGESDEPTAYLYKGINPMGSKAEAPGPTAEERAATAAQTALLQQERDRIASLQAEMAFAVNQARQQLDISATGLGLDQRVQEALTYGDSGSYLNRTLTAQNIGPEPERPAPVQLPNPWETAQGQAIQLAIANHNPAVYYTTLGLQDQLAGKNAAADARAGFDAVYQDFLKRGVEPYEREKARFEADMRRYNQQYAAWDARRQRIGQAAIPTREEYQASTIAELTRRIADTAGPGLSKEFEDRLRKALKEVPEEGQLREALLQRAMEVTTSPEARQAFTNLISRVGRGAAGELPIDPATQRELDRQEATLNTALRRQLGSGYETSTAGSMRLRDYAQARVAAVARDQREGIQSAINSLLSFSAAPGVQLEQIGSLDALQNNRIASALNQQGVYTQNRAANLQNLIGSLQQFEGGEFARRSDVANAYISLQTAPYQPVGAGQLASQYGNLAGALTNRNVTYAQLQPQNVSPGAGIATGALSGAATGATIGSVFPGYGTAIGAAVGAIAGGAGGYLSSR